MCRAHLPWTLGINHICEDESVGYRYETVLLEPFGIYCRFERIRPVHRVEASFKFVQRGPVLWEYPGSSGEHFNFIFGLRISWYYLQECLPEEPCALAHHIMRSVKDWRLLDVLPYASETGGFAGNGSTSAESSSRSDGDRTLLQKMALLVLKSVAVTVKETRYESSSDSSEGSEADDLDADMAVIERSIREVVFCYFRGRENCKVVFLTGFETARFVH